MTADDGQDNAEPGPVLKRWLWFIGLWIAGVAAVGSVSLLLRSILLP